MGGIDKNSKYFFVKFQALFSQKIINIHLFISYKALIRSIVDSGDRQMIYTLIISLLIEKPFYLKLYISNSVRVIDVFVKFSNFMSRGWGFWLPVLSRGEGFCIQWLSRGKGFCILQVMSRRGDGFGWNWYLLRLSYSTFTVHDVKISSVPCQIGTSTRCSTKMSEKSRLIWFQRWQRVLDRQDYSVFVFRFQSDISVDSKIYSSIDLSRIPFWNWGQGWFPISVHLTKASKVWVNVFNPKSCVVLGNN